MAQQARVLCHQRDDDLSLIFRVCRELTSISCHLTYTRMVNKYNTFLKNSCEVPALTSCTFAFFLCASMNIASTPILSVLGIKSQ